MTGFVPLDGDKRPDAVDEALPPIPPGEILTAQFMRPLGLRPTLLAREIRVPINRITEIQCGRRRITAQTALLFGRYFSTSPEFWLRLQMEYDLRAARRSRSTRAHLLGVSRHQPLPEYHKHRE